MSEGGFWSTLRRRKLAAAALLLLTGMLFCALAAPLIAPHDPQAINPPLRLLPPGGEHLFGTDHYGRDTLSRVVYGARMALLIGVGAVLFALAGGTLIGLLSAWFGRLGLVLMRVTDVLMAFPALLLALALILVLGRGAGNSIIAVGAIYLATTARLIYGLTLKLKAEPFVESAATLGAGHTRLLLLHILPNLASPLLVQASFIFAFAQLQAASLDFLGLGIPPEIPSWGNMLSESRRYITRAPWLLIFPGAMIIAASFSLNLFGDFLRDRLDPRFRDAVGRQ